jgi:hypothetical protein
MKAVSNEIALLTGLVEQLEEQLIAKPQLMQNKNI